MLELSIVLDMILDAGLGVELIGKEDCSLIESGLTSSTVEEVDDSGVMGSGDG